MKRWIAAVAAMSAVGAAHASETGFECLLEPWQVVEVRTPVDGIIATISANRGDLVRRGQTLVELQSGAERATLETARYRAKMEGQIVAARNRVEYASKKLMRLNDLMKKDFASAQSRDEADAEKGLAEAELQSAIEARELARTEVLRAQEQLALRTVTAPFAGVVVDRMLNPGDLAEAGSGRKPVLKLAQIDPVRADVALPATLFRKVRVGAGVVVVAAIGGGRFKGTVQSVDRVIDAASSTFVVRVEISNARGQVPSGSRCTASFEGLVPPPHRQ